MKTSIFQKSNKNIVTILALKYFVASWGLPGSFLGLSGDLVSTLGSQIEVPVRLFFFGFFLQPVYLIWVYMFKMNSLFTYLGHVCLLATSFIEFCQMYSSTIHQKSQKIMILFLIRNYGENMTLFSLYLGFLVSLRRTVPQTLGSLPLKKTPLH